MFDYYEGRIVQRGTHRQLVEQPGIYQQIYQLQAQIEDELTEELAFATQSSNGHVNGYHQEVKQKATEGGWIF